VKTRLDLERRLGSDRGQNVAGRLKRIGFKSAPSHLLCSYRMIRFSEKIMLKQEAKAKW
jgi:hypothetical protein